MAILTGVPGVVVTIDVNGQELPEFDDEEEEPQAHTTTKYVEAESGASFGCAVRFHATFPHSDYHILAQLFIDGKCVAHMKYSPGHINSPGNRNVFASVETIHDNRRYKQTFAFAELEITEEKADKSLTGRLGDLGTVALKLLRFRYGPAAPQPAPQPPPKTKNKKAGKGLDVRNWFAPKAPPPQAPPPPPPPKSWDQKPMLENDKVPEKNLKGQAVSHQAKVSAPVEIGTVRPASGPPDTRPFIKIDEEPFAVFSFKYRSRAALQSMFIIPRSPSPVALEDRPLEDLTAEEMRELLRRQREKAADAVKVKKEIKRERGIDSDDGDNDKAEVTEVLQHDRRKKAKTVRSKEVINLSDD